MPEDAEMPEPTLADVSAPQALYKGLYDDGAFCPPAESIETLAARGLIEFDRVRSPLEFRHIHYHLRVTQCESCLALIGSTPQGKEPDSEHSECGTPTRSTVFEPHTDFSKLANRYPIAPGYLGKMLDDLAREVEKKIHETGLKYPNACFNWRVYRRINSWIKHPEARPLSFDETYHSKPSRRDPLPESELLDRRLRQRQGGRELVAGLIEVKGDWRNRLLIDWYFNEFVHAEAMPDGKREAATSRAYDHLLSWDPKYRGNKNSAYQRVCRLRRNYNREYDRLLEALSRDGLSLPKRPRE